MTIEEFNKFTAEELVRHTQTIKRIRKQYSDDNAKYKIGDRIESRQGIRIRVSEILLGVNTLIYYKGVKLRKSDNQPFVTGRKACIYEW